MTRQTSFITENPRRKFTGQYWYNCAFCPRRQFAYAEDRAEANSELEKIGWLVSPNTCPKCKTERARIQAGAT